MKELETHTKIGKEAKVELAIKKQQEIEYILHGVIAPKVGHVVWEINEETGEIKKADYKKDTVTFNFMAKKEPEKLIVNKDCIYIPALNSENAKRKYLKNKEQSFYYKKEPLLKLNDITF
tara:strand:+ start:5761 stop:6120 length:360 start_codon:yes stop_codon:yes gene_type:complete